MKLSQQETLAYLDTLLSEERNDFASISNDYLKHIIGTSGTALTEAGHAYKKAMDELNRRRQSEIRAEDEERE